MNAATLALINAGIPMTCFLCAVTVGFLDSTPVLGKCRRRRCAVAVLVVVIVVVVVVLVL